MSTCPPTIPAGAQPCCARVETPDSRGRSKTAPLQFGTAILLGVLCSAAHAATPAPYLKPEDALKTFQLEPGLRIELVAAEPLVIDPVAFAFDDEGRLYVVENRGYPGAVKSNQTIADAPVEPLGRIARLEDTDGDGRYDRRTEFAGGFTYPNGIAIWRGGVFVTCAPDIVYLKDNDGDGVADERRVVLTGFETTRTTQLRVSHPTLGLDGKFYVPSGLNGGKVTSPLHPEREPVTFTPSDGRFDPETFVYERTGGRGQFGLSFDAFGRRFICSNRHPVLQVVLEPWHLKRNPHLAFTDTTQEVSKVEAQAKVFRISRSVITADFMPTLMSKPHAGTFTSACGVLLFGGTGLQADHNGNVFVCEPAQNLVQRQVLRPEGASFRSDLAYEGREFLASTDVWFRPVFLGEGPDGALYVADMHRREIDHPQYVPEEARGRLDFESGKGTGRIYRIVRTDRAQPAAVARPRKTDTPDELVRQLESPDAWWRSRAHRLLLERGDATVAPALEKLIASAPRAETRTVALWVLHGLRKLSIASVQQALRDRHAGVREQGLLLAGEMLSDATARADAVLAMADDPDPRVRFIAALVLGATDGSRVVRALAAIADRADADRWTRAAVLSGIGTRMGEFLGAVTAAKPTSPAARAVLMEELARTFGAGASTDECRSFLATTLTGEGDLMWRVPAVLGLAEGLRGRAEFKGKANPLAEVADRDALAAFTRTAAAVAADTAAPARQRVSAIALLGYSDFERAGPVLGGLLDARHAPELQIQAIRALDRLGDPRGAELLVREDNWSRYTASVREAVIATLTSRPRMIDVLFAAIQRGTIKPPEISSTRRTQLQKHSDATIRKTAEALFADLEGGDRMKVYRDLRTALAAPADAPRGAEVFTRACAACHTYHGAGGKVGPDLSGVRHQPADALLMHIIVPNYEVVPAYQTITAVMDDGRTLAGWLTSETDTSLSLRTAAGTEEILLRKNIKTLTASGVSLMPDGLEQTMTKDELVNLIAYLKQEPPAGR